MISKIAGVLVGIFFVILAIVGLSLLMALPLKWTWNAVMPYMFGLPTLTVVKAWCLSFVAGCLIKPHSFSVKN